ncbi:MAG: GNAT family N-acetyltransferase [Nocardioides sp.]
MTTPVQTTISGTTEGARMPTTTTWPVSAGSPFDVLLADGSIGTIRRVTPDDGEDVERLHDELAADSLRMRFFNTSHRAAHAYVEHVLASCEEGHVLALGLWHDQRLAGLGTAELVDDTSAEIAFVVSDAEHGRGVATLLLEYLAATARDAGVRRFDAEVLVDNAPMLQVVRDAGFAVSRHSSDGVVSIAMDTAVTPGSLAASDHREYVSETASLRPLLAPRHVAVVGVRRDGTGIGAAILSAVLEGGFTGSVTAVHPAGQVAAPVTTVRGFGDLAEPPDLVVVAVPPHQVVDTVVDAARHGARAAVVVTSGFAEMGAEGAELQRRLTRAAREHGIRVVGPNCLGLLDNQPDVRLDATFGRGIPPPGGLAVASQSGGVGIVVLEAARQLGLGVRHFVSLGNKADVSSNDLLAAWLPDPGVTTAALYLESFGNPAKFARIARAFSERKPLIAVVGGRTGSGQRAGASHTAAAATPSVRVEALFAQAGVIACADAEDLTHTALLLDGQPLPRGRRVAVLGNAGGLGVLAADALVDAGLDVPAFSEHLSARLGRHVSASSGTSNPVDAGAGGTASALGLALETMLTSDEADSVLLTLVRTRTTDWERTLAALAEARRRRPDKPVVAVLLGGGGDPASVPGLTVLPSLAGAVRALAHVVGYSSWLSRPPEPAPPEDADRTSTVRSWARDHVAGSGAGWLGPVDGRALLAPYGLHPTGVVVTGAEGAVHAAEEIGLPVAVKVADPAVVHKTELGLVRPGLRTVDEVRTAAEQITATMANPQVELLVQPMGSGTEVVVGVVRDPGLGPLVLVGAGGTATDLWQDHRLLLSPVSSRDVANALASLRIWPLLAGFRGSEPADVDSLVELVVSVGQLAREVPELAELDLNPVLVGPTGCQVVDVKARLAPADPLDDGIPRHLRS